MRNKIAIAIVAAYMSLVLSGCQSKEVQIVLLPQEGGRVGKVEVSTEKGASTLIDKAWESAQVKKDGNVETKLQDEATVMKQFGATIKALPNPSVSHFVFFGSESAQPDAASSKELVNIVEQIKNSKPSLIVCAGHTDSTGEKGYNKTLSLKRAQTVANYLIKHGIDKNIIEVRHYGDANPLVKTAPGASNPKNRRVEIIVR